MSYKAAEMLMPPRTRTRGNAIETTYPTAGVFKSNLTMAPNRAFRTCRRTASSWTGAAICF
jgi:hypothetical protein